MRRIYAFAFFICCLVAVLSPTSVFAVGNAADKKCPQPQINVQEYAEGEFKPTFTRKVGGETKTIKNLYGMVCTDETNKCITTGKCVGPTDCKATTRCDGGDLKKPDVPVQSTGAGTGGAAPGGTGGTGSTDPNQAGDTTNTAKPDPYQSILDQAVSQQDQTLKSGEDMTAEVKQAAFETLTKDLQPLDNSTTQTPTTDADKAAITTAVKDSFPSLSDAAVARIANGVDPTNGVPVDEQVREAVSQELKNATPSQNTFGDAAPQEAKPAEQNWFQKAWSEVTGAVSGAVAYVENLSNPFSNRGDTAATTNPAGDFNQGEQPVNTETPSTELTQQQLDAAARKIDADTAAGREQNPVGERMITIAEAKFSAQMMLANLDIRNNMSAQLQGILGSAVYADNYLDRQLQIPESVIRDGVNWNNLDPGTRQFVETSLNYSPTSNVGNGGSPGDGVPLGPSEPGPPTMVAGLQQYQTDHPFGDMQQYYSENAYVGQAADTSEATASLPAGNTTAGPISNPMGDFNPGEQTPTVDPSSTVKPDTTANTEVTPKADTGERAPSAAEKDREAVDAYIPPDATRKALEERAALDTERLRELGNDLKAAEASKDKAAIAEANRAMEEFVKSAGKGDLDFKDPKVIAALNNGFCTGSNCGDGLIGPEKPTPESEALRKIVEDAQTSKCGFVGCLADSAVPRSEADAAIKEIQKTIQEQGYDVRLVGNRLVLADPSDAKDFTADIKDSMKQYVENNAVVAILEGKAASLAGDWYKSEFLGDPLLQLAKPAGNTAGEMITDFTETTKNFSDEVSKVPVAGYDSSGKPIYTSENQLKVASLAAEYNAYAANAKDSIIAQQKFDSGQTVEGAVYKALSEKEQTLNESIKRTELALERVQNANPERYVGGEEGRAAEQARLEGSLEQKMQDREALLKAQDTARNGNLNDLPAEYKKAVELARQGEGSVAQWMRETQEKLQQRSDSLGTYTDARTAFETAGKDGFQDYFDKIDKAATIVVERLANDLESSIIGDAKQLGGRLNDLAEGKIAALNTGALESASCAVNGCTGQTLWSGLNTALNATVIGDVGKLALTELRVAGSALGFGTTEALSVAARDAAGGYIAATSEFAVRADAGVANSVVRDGLADTVGETTRVAAADAADARALGYDLKAEAALRDAETARESGATALAAQRSAQALIAEDAATAARAEAQTLREAAVKATEPATDAGVQEAKAALEKAGLRVEERGPANARYEAIVNDSGKELFTRANELRPWEATSKSISDSVFGETAAKLTEADRAVFAREQPFSAMQAENRAANVSKEIQAQLGNDAERILADSRAGKELSAVDAAKLDTLEKALGMSYKDISSVLKQLETGASKELLAKSLAATEKAEKNLADQLAKTLPDGAKSSKTKIGDAFLQAEAKYKATNFGGSLMDQVAAKNAIAEKFAALAEGHEALREGQKIAIYATSNGKAINAATSFGKSSVAVGDYIQTRLTLGKGAQWEYLAPTTELNAKFAKDYGEFFKEIGSPVQVIKGANPAEFIAATRTGKDGAGAVIAMAPETRGHLIGQSLGVSSEATALKTALSETRKAIVDEVHNLAGSRTSSIISEGERLATAAERTAVTERLDKLGLSRTADGYAGAPKALERYEGTGVGNRAQLSDMEGKNAEKFARDFTNNPKPMYLAEQNLNGEVGAVRYNLAGQQKLADLGLSASDRTTQSVLRTLELREGEGNAFRFVEAEGDKPARYVPTDKDGAAQYAQQFSDPTIPATLAEINGKRDLDIFVGVTKAETPLTHIFATNPGMLVGGMTGTAEGLESLLKAGIGTDGVLAIKPSRLDIGAFKTEAETVSANGEITKTPWTQESVLARQEAALAEGKNTLTIATTRDEFNAARTAMRDVAGEGKAVRLVEKDGDTILVNGKPTTESFNDLARQAKDVQTAFVVDRTGATGFDYQGKFVQAILGPLDRESFVQALGRVGRANGDTFWAAERNVVANTAALDSQLEGALLNGYREEVAKAIAANGSADGLGAKLFEKAQANEGIEGYGLTLNERVALGSDISTASILSDARDFAMRRGLNEASTNAPLKDILNTSGLTDAERTAVQAKYSERLQIETSELDATIKPTSSLNAVDAHIENVFKSTIEDARGAYNDLRATLPKDLSPQMEQALAKWDAKLTAAENAKYADIAGTTKGTFAAAESPVDALAIAKGSLRDGLIPPALVPDSVASIAVRSADTSIVTRVENAITSEARTITDGVTNTIRAAEQSVASAFSSVRTGALAFASAVEQQFGIATESSSGDATLPENATLTSGTLSPGDSVPGASAAQSAPGSVPQFLPDENGKLADAANGLSEGPKTMLKEWQGNESNSLERVRNAARSLWGGENVSNPADTQSLKELYDRGQALRDNLSRFADENGKVRLYRGLSNDSLRNAPSVQSFTTNKEMAKSLAFAGKNGVVIEQLVPVSDVIFEGNLTEGEVLVRTSDALAFDLAGLASKRSLPSSEWNPSVQFPRLSAAMQQGTELDVNALFREALGDPEAIAIEDAARHAARVEEAKVLRSVSIPVTGMSDPSLTLEARANLDAQVKNGTRAPRKSYAAPADAQVQYPKALDAALQKNSAGIFATEKSKPITVSSVKTDEGAGVTLEQTVRAYQLAPGVTLFEYYAQVNEAGGLPYRAESHLALKDDSSGKVLYLNALTPPEYTFIPSNWFNQVQDQNYRPQSYTYEPRKGEFNLSGYRHMGIESVRRPTGERVREGYILYGNLNGIGSLLGLLHEEGHAYQDAYGLMDARDQLNELYAVIRNAASLSDVDRAIARSLQYYGPETNRGRVITDSKIGLKARADVTDRDSILWQASPESDSVVAVSKDWLAPVMRDYTAEEREASLFALRTWAALDKLGFKAFTPEQLAETVDLANKCLGTYEANQSCLVASSGKSFVSDLLHIDEVGSLGKNISALQAGAQALSTNPAALTTGPSNVIPQRSATNFIQRLIRPVVIALSLLFGQPLVSNVLPDSIAPTFDSGAQASQPKSAQPDTSPIQASKEPYSAQEVKDWIKTLGLDKVPVDVAVKILPPRPVESPNLQRETSPLLLKKASELTNLDLAEIVNQGMDSVNALFKNVYKQNGGVYRPMTVQIIDSENQSVPMGAGSNFFRETGVVQVDIKNFRQVAKKNPNITGAVLMGIQIHEMMHHVVALLGLDLNAEDAQKLDRIAPPLTEATGYSIDSLTELQADYLTGWVLMHAKDSNGAPLLKRGELAQIYYAFAFFADDIQFAQVGKIFNANDPAFSRTTATPHGTAVERGRALLEGANGGTLEEGLAYLGTKPDWKLANPDIPWDKIVTSTRTSPSDTTATLPGSTPAETVPTPLDSAPLSDVTTISPSRNLSLNPGDRAGISNSDTDSAAQSQSTWGDWLTSFSSQFSNPFVSSAWAASAADHIKFLENSKRDLGKVQQGIASYYDLAGVDSLNPSNITASGAIHNRTEYTVAMLGGAPKYAWGTKLAVKNIQMVKDGKGNLVRGPDYGKEVIVVVNSSGSYKGRQIDLSPAAAKAIGIYGNPGAVEFSVVYVPSDQTALSYKVGRSDLRDGGVVPSGTLETKVAEIQNANPSQFAKNGPATSPDTTATLPVGAPSDIDKITGAPGSNQSVIPNVLPVLPQVPATNIKTNSIQTPSHKEISTSSVAPGKVLYYTPEGFDATKSMSIIYYLHGNGGSITDLVDRQKIIQQIHDSGCNCALVAPEFGNPVNERTGNLGKSDGWKNFAAETAQRLGKLSGDSVTATAFAQAPAFVIAYSGGGSPARAAVSSGVPLRGVVLLDAAYGDMAPFATWKTSNPNSFLVSASIPSKVSDTQANNNTLAQLLLKQGIQVKTSPLQAGQSATGAQIFSTPNLSHTNFVTNAWISNPIQNIVASNVALRSASPAVAVGQPSSADTTATLNKTPATRGALEVISGVKPSSQAPAVGVGPANPKAQTVPGNPIKDIFDSIGKGFKSIGASMTKLTPNDSAIKMVLDAEKINPNITKIEELKMLRDLGYGATETYTNVREAAAKQVSGTSDPSAADYKTIDTRVAAASSGLDARAKEIAARVKAADPQATSLDVAAQIYMGGVQNTPTFDALRKSIAKETAGLDPKVTPNEVIGKKVADLMKPVGYPNVAPGTLAPEIISISRSGTAITPQKIVDDYLFNKYTDTYAKIDSSGDFTWKDIAASLNAGMSLRDYTIGGMNPTIKLNLYYAGKAMDAEGIKWSFLAAYRGLERPVPVGTVVANPRNSQHYAGGYGNGNAADISGVPDSYDPTSIDAANQKVWDWLSKNGSHYGIRANFIANDPAHVQPTGSSKVIETQTAAISGEAKQVIASNASKVAPKADTTATVPVKKTNASDPFEAVRASPFSMYGTTLQDPFIYVDPSAAAEGKSAELDISNANVSKNIPIPDWYEVSAENITLQIMGTINVATQKIEGAAVAAREIKAEEETKAYEQAYKNADKKIPLPSVADVPSINLQIEDDIASKIPVPEAAPIDLSFNQPNPAGVVERGPDLEQPHPVGVVEQGKPLADLTPFENTPAGIEAAKKALDEQNAQLAKDVQAALDTAVEKPSIGAVDSLSTHPSGTVVKGIDLKDLTNTLEQIPTPVTFQPITNNFPGLVGGAEAGAKNVTTRVVEIGELMPKPNIISVEELDALIQADAAKILKDAQLATQAPGQANVVVPVPNSIPLPQPRPVGALQNVPGVSTDAILATGPSAKTIELIQRFDQLKAARAENIANAHVMENKLSQIKQLQGLVQNAQSSLASSRAGLNTLSSVVGALKMTPSAQETASMTNGVVATKVLGSQIGKMAANPQFAQLKLGGAGALQAQINAYIGQLNALQASPGLGAANSAIAKGQALVASAQVFLSQANAGVSTLGVKQLQAQLSQVQADGKHMGAQIRDVMQDIYNESTGPVSVSAPAIVQAPSQIVQQATEEALVQIVENTAADSGVEAAPLAEDSAATLPASPEPSLPSAPIDSFGVNSRARDPKNKIVQKTGVPAEPVDTPDAETGKVAATLTIGPSPASLGEQFLREFEKTLDEIVAAEKNLQDKIFPPNPDLSSLPTIYKKYSLSDAPKPAANDNSQTPSVAIPEAVLTSPNIVDTGTQISRMPAQEPGFFGKNVKDGAITLDQAKDLLNIIYKGNPELRALDDVQGHINDGKVYTSDQMKKIADEIGQSLKERYGVGFEYVSFAGRDSKGNPLFKDPTSHLSIILPADTGLTPLITDPATGNASSENVNPGSYSETTKTIYFYKELMTNPEKLVTEIRHEVGVVLIGNAVAGKDKIPFVTELGVYSTHALDVFHPEVSSDIRASADDMLVRAGFAEAKAPSTPPPLPQATESVVERSAAVRAGANPSTLGQSIALLEGPNIVAIRAVDSPMVGGVPVVLTNFDAPNNAKVTITANDLASIGGQKRLQNYVKNETTRGLVSVSDRDALSLMRITGLPPEGITFYPLPAEPKVLGFVERLKNLIFGSSPSSVISTTGGGGGTNQTPWWRRTLSAISRLLNADLSSEQPSKKDDTTATLPGKPIVTIGASDPDTKRANDLWQKYQDLMKIVPAKDSTTPPGTVPTAKPPIGPGAGKTGPGPGGKPGAVPDNMPGGSGGGSGGSGGGNQSKGGIGGMISSLGQLIGKLFGQDPEKKSQQPIATSTKNIIPTSSIIASPLLVKAGATSTLTWASINATSCSLTGADGVEIGTGLPDGSATSPVLATSTRFTVICVSATGATTSARTTIRIEH